MSTFIDGLRDWLQTCPAVSDALGDFGAVRLNCIAAEPVSFSVEDEPGEPVVTRYFSGAIKQRNFNFVSVQEYSDADAVQIANSTVFDDLSAWVSKQDAARNFPTLPDSRTCTGVEVTTTPYLIQSTATTCRVQLQLTVQFYAPKGA